MACYAWQTLPLCANTPVAHHAIQRTPVTMATEQEYAQTIQAQTITPCSKFSASASMQKKRKIKSIAHTPIKDYFIIQETKIMVYGCMRFQYCRRCLRSKCAGCGGSTSSCCLDSKNAIKQWFEKSPVEYSDCYKRKFGRIVSDTVAGHEFAILQMAVTFALHS